jgi:thymidine kinase
MLPKLSLFCGPMFSGKTNRLLQTVDAARLHGMQVVVIKHVIGRDSTHVRSRTGLFVEANFSVNKLDPAVIAAGGQGGPRSTSTQQILYAVDESQFFGESLLDFWRFIERGPHHLAIASLDTDFQRKPFGLAGELARQALSSPHAVHIEKLTAKCVHRSGDRVCGQPAPFTQRLMRGGRELIKVEDDYYAAACATHHVPAPMDEQEWMK